MTMGIFAKRRIGLAPMEGVTDFPARVWMSLAGEQGFMCTPFLRVTETYRGRIPADFAPEWRLGQDNFSYRLLPQIMTADADAFSETADMMLEAGAPLVDLNCGCPSPRCARGGAGAALLGRLDHLRGLVETISGRRPGQVSVKIRLGIAESRELPQVIEVLQDAPLHHLTIHGRTSQQRYQGHADWDLLDWAAVRLKQRFPVMGSGDIKDHQSWRQVSGGAVEHFIVGRGALSNPWVFHELEEDSEDQAAIDHDLRLAGLRVFALLNIAFGHEPDRLDGWVRQGFFREPCGKSAAAWKLLSRSLMDSWPELGEVEEVDHQDFGLNRMKMMWRYQASTDPQRYRAQLRYVLRSQSYREFFQRLGSTS